MTATPKPRTVRLLDREPAGKAKPEEPKKPGLFWGEKPAPASAAPREVAGFTIARGIPIPEKRTRFSSILNTLPFRELEVGESFVAPDFNHKNGYQLCQRMAKAAPGRKFVTRKVGDGVRIWRTA